MKKRRAEYGQKYYDKFAGTKVSEPASVGSVAAPATGKKMVRTTAQVNARAGKSTKTDKLGTFLGGTELEWIATEDGWHKVAVWVSGDFSRVVTK